MDAAHASGAPQLSLSIVIPAFNEEQAIASIISRTLAARESLCREAALSGVEVIVVNDGSTDATPVIASRFPDVILVSYQHNRGYGAAIKEGFSRARGHLLAFIDADGTCDPLFFGALCRNLQEQNADIALGARLGPDSQMPAVRRIGNHVYAGILGAWGARGVTDSASGMRVVRRSALPLLYPLPDGMHFTPAMSSIALFDPRLTIIEVPMRYSERTGVSKLRVARDGARFLLTIADTALSYRPLRFFGAAGSVLLLLALAYGISPVAYYLAERRIAEWMYYRLSAVAVAVTGGVTFLVVGVLSQQAVDLIHDDARPAQRWRERAHHLLRRQFLPIGLGLLISAIALNWSSLASYLSHGTVSAHWIYILAGGLLAALGIQCIAYGVLARAIHLLSERRRAARGPSR